MGVLDKFKKMFIEEVEDEEVIEKRTIKVKIPKPEETKPVTPEPKPVEFDEEVEEEEEKEEVKMPIPEPVIETPKRVEIAREKEPVKSIPTFYDDDDFSPTMELKRIEKKPQVKQEYKYTKTETIYSPTITGYGIKRDEPRKKAFTPTPIISPVYGVLDKNYRKEEIRSKNTIRVSNDPDRVSVEDIRKKAYGTLEDELENELSGNIETEKLINETPLFNDFMDTISKEEENPIDIFGEIERKDALDDYIMGFGNDKNNSSTSLVEDELNKDYDKYEEELNKTRTKSYSDDDLFNLIDSMYRKKDGDL